MTLPLCASCGMAMAPKQRAGSCCIYCTSPTGELKPRETVRAGLVHFFMRSRSTDRASAERLVDQHLALMPAWQKAPKAAAAQRPPALQKAVSAKRAPAAKGARARRRR